MGPQNRGLRGTRRQQAGSLGAGGRWVSTWLAVGDSEMCAAPPCSLVRACAALLRGGHRHPHSHWDSHTVAKNRHTNRQDEQKWHANAQEPSPRLFHLDHTNKKHLSTFLHHESGGKMPRHAIRPSLFCDFTMSLISRTKPWVTFVYSLPPAASAKWENSSVRPASQRWVC